MVGSGVIVQRLLFLGSLENLVVDLCSLVLSLAAHWVLTPLDLLYLFFFLSFPGKKSKPALRLPKEVFEQAPPAAAA